MHVTSDRSRKLAAMMFAALMLQACDTTDAGGKSVANAAQPNADGIGGKAIPGEATDPCGIGGPSSTVQFATDASDLSEDAQKILQNQACWMGEFPAQTFTIEGHADERGTREYNLALGERRANAIANYLVALGVEKSRIWVISYGKERPICDDASDACWAQNRRGVTTVNSQ
jgi:peptidoglycan-associated lipoprotein